MKALTIMLLNSSFKRLLLSIFCRLCWALFLVLSSGITLGQTSGKDMADDHELTIYVVRSVGPINWESPSTLYKSFVRSYLDHLFRKEMTLTGHLFVKLSTPLIDEPLYAGMCTPSKKERRMLVLKERIGLAVLGASMKAKLENRNDLIKKIDYYSRKNEIAFITYHINEQSAKRIIDFYKGFTSTSSKNNVPCNYYGGAFWPRYIGEGAGCTAFGIAMLELSGLLSKESNSWKRNVNIPMYLIGGNFNNDHRIGSRMIKKTNSWNDGSGVENVDFVPFSVYDPSLIYYWVLDQRKPGNTPRSWDYLPAEEAFIPGLSADRRRVTISAGDSIFIRRPQPNLFIEEFYEILSKDR